MVGGTVGEVVESKANGFSVGEFVVNPFGGWQEYCVVGASGQAALNKVDPKKVHVHHYLGAVGMPGITAWLGLLHFCKAKVRHCTPACLPALCLTCSLATHPSNPTLPLPLPSLAEGRDCVRELSERRSRQCGRPAGQEARLPRHRYCGRP